MICMHYMFDDKTCMEDDLPCGFSCGPGEAPESIDRCRNEKYKPFLLQEGYSGLVMKELRDY